MADPKTCATEKRAKRRKDVEKRYRWRFLKPKTWIFCSSRTTNGQFYFSEFSEADNELVFGLMIVATRRYGVELAGFVLMSGHLHALLRARRGRQISSWMQYVKAGIARLVRSKYGTDGPIWGSRFKSINLLDDEAEGEVLDYICLHGVKEGAVSTPMAWPLANTVGALIGEGWIYGKVPSRLGDGKLVVVKAQLTPLSRWSDRRQYHREMKVRVDQLIAVEALARALNREDPAPKDASDRVQDWCHIPVEIKRSTSKTFKASGFDAKRLLSEAYEARVEGITGAIKAAGILVQRGGCAQTALSELLEWPPFVTAAQVDEGFIEMSFVEAVHGVASPI